MASLFSAINSSLLGLQASTAQMQLVSDNISNAGQLGYTRKSAVLSPVSLGTQGGGVMVTGYARATDEALKATLNSTLSESGNYSTQNGYMQQVLSFLGQTGDNSGNPPLSNAVSQLSTSFIQLAAAPESNVQQQQVIQAATNFVDQIKNASADVETLDRQVSTDINSTLKDLNSYLEQINLLNHEISKGLGAGIDVGNVQDARDQLVQKIASMMNVREMQRSNGAVALYTGAGYMLLDGDQTLKFSYDGTNVTSNLEPTRSLNDILSGGSLQAAVNFRATTSPASTDLGTSVIQKLRSQLDALANAFTDVSAGPPASFAYTYNTTTGQTGEASYIFSGTDRLSIAVNPTLLNNSESLKVNSPNAMVSAFNAETRNFTADGLNLTGGYTSLAVSFLANFQQAASSIAQNNDSADQQKTYLTNRLQNVSGVNVDTELVNLTTLQNSYAASARVIQVVQGLLDTLLRISG